MKIETIRWVDNRVRIIDQRLLPLQLKYEDITTAKQMWRAIKQLRVRGAPAIGVAAAFGVYLGVRGWRGNDNVKFHEKIFETADYIGSARPTAVNLFWALDLARKTSMPVSRKTVAAVKRDLLNLALELLRDDRERCEAIGRHGAMLLPARGTVITHCNAGALATAGMGTALAVIYTAVKQGKKIKVFADETRPLLQGARLTAWELTKSRIPVTLICDNMAAMVMAKHQIDAVIVGADRITMSGDFANKIGTYSLAVNARVHDIPFFVAAPLSTFDAALKVGRDIPIELREADEITHIGNTQIAPDNVCVYNPAFDVTPARYVTAFITEKGVITPPFSSKIREIIRRSN